MFHNPFGCVSHVHALLLHRIRHEFVELEHAVQNWLLTETDDTGDDDVDLSTVSVSPGRLRLTKPDLRVQHGSLTGDPRRDQAYEMASMAGSPVRSTKYVSPRFAAQRQ